MNTMKPALALLLLHLHIALASNHTNDTSSDDGGLSGGAIAGIVIGVIAALGLVGAGVYLYMMPGALKSLTGMGGGSAAAAPTSKRMGDNHLPMMAMRVNNDDDI